MSEMHCKLGKIKKRATSGVFGELSPQLSALWLPYLDTDLGRAVIFSRPLLLGKFVDLKYSLSPTEHAFNYSFVKYLTSHMVTVGGSYVYSLSFPEISYHSVFPLCSKHVLCQKADS